MPRGALARVCFMLLVPASALAADAVVFHDGPLPADGRTDSLVQLVVPGLADTDRVTATAKGGRVVDMEVGSGGALFLTLRPARVGRPGVLELNISVKTPEAKVKDTIDLPVVPTAHGELEISFEPEELPGPDGGVLVRVRPTTDTALPRDRRPVQLQASMGQLDELALGSDGVWSALYAPPAGLDSPAAVLFTAVDLSDPMRIRGAAALPIRDDVTRTLPAPPSGQASLTAGEVHLGPVEVPSEGYVDWSWSMAPAHQTGTLTTTNIEDETVSTEVTLDNPAPPALSFLPYPDGMGLPAGQSVSLWLAARDAGGFPEDAVPGLVIEAPGTFEVRHAGDGWHEVVVQVPAEPGRFALQATIGERTASLALRAVPPLPVIALVGEPEELAADSTEALVIGRFLVGRGGRQDGDLSLEPLGSNLVAAPRVADGAVAARVAASGGRVLVTGGVPFTGTGLPPVRLRMWSGTGWAEPGQPLPLFVVVEDALGLPVPNAEVQLAPSDRLQGLPGSVSTGVNGWAMLPIARVTGDPESPIGLSGSSEGLEAGTVLWPHTGALGTTADARALSRWGVALPTLVLRTGAPAVGTAVEGARAVASDRGVVEEQLEAARIAAKPIAEPGETGWRLRAGVVDLGLAFKQTRSDNEERFPPDASFSNHLPAGALGVSVGAEAWFSEGWGAEARARIARYRVDIEGDVQGDTVGYVMAGFRYRQSFGNGPWGWQLGLWGHATDAVVFGYNEQRTAARLQGFGILGGRVGWAFAWDPSFLHARLEIAETFAPLPSDTYAGLHLDIPLFELGGNHVAISPAFTADWRHAGYATDVAKVFMMDLQLAGMIEVGWGSLH